MAPVGHALMHRPQPLHFSWLISGLSSALQRPGPAALLEDVLFVFLAEVAHRREHRIRRRLSQAAQRANLHRASQFLQQVKRVCIGAAFNHVVEQRKQLLGSFAAQHALAAGFALRKLHEEARNAHHAGALVHHHQAAGADHGADRSQRLVGQRQDRDGPRSGIRRRGRRSARP